MLTKLPYGKSEIEFDIDPSRLLGVIAPSEVSPAKNPTLEVEKALRTPLDGPTIEELSPKGKAVAITPRCDRSRRGYTMY